MCGIKNIVQLAIASQKICSVHLTEYFIYQWVGYIWSVDIFGDEFITDLFWKTGDEIDNDQHLGKVMGLSIETFSIIVVASYLLCPFLPSALYKCFLWIYLGSEALVFEPVLETSMFWSVCLQLSSLQVL